MRPLSLRFVAPLLALVSLARPLLAELPVRGKWEQVGEEAGIRLWQSEVPGLDLPGFRGEVTIGASLQAVESVIRDHMHHTDWMHRCARSLLLERVGEDDALLYHRTRSPWPLWDRDVVLETHVTHAFDGQTIIFSFRNAKHSRYPLPDRVVRMPRLVGFYRLVRRAEAETAVTFQVEADPGGSLPRWLASRVARELPFETLLRLRVRAAQAK